MESTNFYVTKIKCRFAKCHWEGTETTIFRHVELYHKQFLCEPLAKNYYDFVLSDLQTPTYALVSTEGLYWFCENPLTENICNALIFGLFHIGQTECKEYTLKFGLRRDGYYEYWGPFKTQPALSFEDRHKEVYELAFHFKQLEELNRKIPSRKLRIYFGAFDDSDDVKWPSSSDWEAMTVEQRLLAVNWKDLVCIVCYEFIRKDVKFCENKHFICLECFDSMSATRRLKCPICRGIYEYDCSDDKLECWLRLLKWPLE